MTSAEAATLTAPEQKGIDVLLDQGGAADPKNLRELFALAKVVVQSGLVKVATEQAAMVVMQYGAEIGLKGLAAFNYIYIVGERPRLRPDGAKALALHSGALEDFREELIGEGETREAVVTVKRKGIATPIVRRFSVLDARKARLEKKDNWQGYQDRMLLARARGFAFQDAFADLCGGLQIRETFDLEPDEVLGQTVPRPIRPKTGADPIFAKLGVPVASKPEPVDAVIVPEMTHAEADQAIADSEK